MEYVRNISNDVQVLRSIWFGKIEGDTHKERLESLGGSTGPKRMFVSCLFPLLLVQPFVLVVSRYSPSEHCIFEASCAVFDFEPGLLHG